MTMLRAALFVAAATFLTSCISEECKQCSAASVTKDPSGQVVSQDTVSLGEKCGAELIATEAIGTQSVPVDTFTVTTTTFCQ